MVGAFQCPLASGWGWSLGRLSLSCSAPWVEGVFAGATYKHECAAPFDSRSGPGLQLYSQEEAGALVSSESVP